MHPTFSFLRHTAFCASAIGWVLGAGLAAATDQTIVKHPGDHIAPEAIELRLANPHPNGAKPANILDVDAIPTAWSVAIVAAEDPHFWSHSGFDLRGISRAMLHNGAAGKPVQGRSTLTHRTAKILFERPDRSLKGHGVELLNVARLEAHYEKSEILRFYANSTYYAHGQIGLAAGAEYYFGRSPESLSVVEAAFLAGMRRSPRRADPIEGDPEYTVARTEYVLERIVALPAADLTPPRGDGESWGAHQRRIEEVEALQAEAERALTRDVALDFAPRS